MKGGGGGVRTLQYNQTLSPCVSVNIVTLKLRSGGGGGDGGVAFEALPGCGGGRFQDFVGIKSGMS